MSLFSPLTPNLASVSVNYSSPLQYCFKYPPLAKSSHFKNIPTAKHPADKSAAMEISQTKRTNTKIFSLKNCSLILFMIYFKEAG